MSPERKAGSRKRHADHVAIAHGEMLLPVGSFNVLRGSHNITITNEGPGIYAF